MDVMRAQDGASIWHSHCSHLKVLHDTSRGVFYHAHMSDPDSNPTRTLTLVLPEDDWKALRAVEPDAIGWLRVQIQHRLAEGDADVHSGPSTPWSSRSNPASASTAETWWGNEDEY
jgi:hypothetical protein